MQDTVKARLEGPTPIRGYYFDDQCKRYFAIPKSGSMGWNQYQATMARYIQDMQDSLPPAKPKPVRLSGLNSFVSVVDALLEIRTGYRKSTMHYTRRVLEKAFVLGSELVELPLDERGVSKVLQSPLAEDEIFVGFTSSIKKLFIRADVPEVLEQSEQLQQEELSGLEIDPRGSVLSSTHFSGLIQIRDLSTLATMLEPQTPFPSGIWCHKWLGSDSIFCGSDRSAYLVHPETMRLNFVYSEKSSVFSVATAPRWTTTFCFGTRAGNVFLSDSRALSNLKKSSRTSIKHSAPVNDLVMMSNGTQLLSCGTDGTVILSDLRTHKSVATWLALEGCRNTARLCINDMEDRLTLLGTDSKIRLFDLNNLATPASLAQHDADHSVGDLIWSSRWGKRCYSGFGMIGDSITVLQVPR